jgi:phosphoribosylformylglycinamidine cyclo-ligase
LGHGLLEPTRIYAASCLAALRQNPDGVKALAHITGGGVTENVPRVLPATLGVRVYLQCLVVPPVLKWLAQTGEIAPPEMLRTFNCGIGMVAIVDPMSVEAVSAVLSRYGEAVVPLGEVIPAAQSPRVEYVGDLDLG